MGTESCCTGHHPYHMTAIVYFAANFLWPHLKLLAVCTCFYMKLTSRRKRTVLYWLTFFGKWTLMDALSSARVQSNQTRAA